MILPPLVRIDLDKGGFLLKKLPIFYGALLLTAVNLLLRFGGTVFQVYLSGRIGAEGIGLLQLVLSVGSMAMVAGIAGIRTATMYLTAEQIGKKKRQNIIWVLSCGTNYALVCSVLVGGIVYITAPLIAANWIGHEDVADSIRLLGIFLPVNCLCGMMVGYFTGAGRIGTLAAVEVVEQVFGACITILLLAFWAENSTQKACISVILGSSIGACLTLVTLTVLRIRERAEHGNKIRLGRKLLDTALPLAIADDLRTGISTVENLMVPKRLALYGGVISPLAAFGSVCGMVFPILMFPASLLFGINELIIPELARCNAAGETGRIAHLVKKGLKIALIYGTACSGILLLCADELCMALYQNADAGKYLEWFAPLAVMLYCDSITDAMIKGLGQQKISVRYNIFTNILDVAFLYILLPKLGIFGYFVSFSVTHAINFFLSLRRLLFITGRKIRFLLPVLTVAAGAAGVLICSRIDGGFVKTLLFLPVFGAILALLGVVRKDDIAWVKGLIYKK